MVDILKLRKMSEEPKQEVASPVITKPTGVPVAAEPRADSTTTPEQSGDGTVEASKSTRKKDSSVSPKSDRTKNELNEEAGAAIEQSKTDDSSQEDQNVIDLVAFTLADRLFGVDITKVQEVVRYTEISRVPNADVYVLGVMNLRGNITPVIDLHKRFSLPEASWTDKTRIIVLQIKDQAIGFLVDHVSEIMHPLESDIESTSNVHANIRTDYISGVVKIRDHDENSKKLLILLNLEKIFEEGSVALA